MNGPGQIPMNGASDHAYGDDADVGVDLGGVEPGVAQHLMLRSGCALAGHVAMLLP